MKKQFENKKQIKTIFRVILLAFIALIVGVNVYTINASRIAGNTVPMPFGVGSAVVLSGSMEPEISAGDLVVVIESYDYKVGDVVVYQDGRMAVTHRIVSISEDEVITRGDANNVEDDPISVEQIKGKVAVAIPLVGYVVNAIKTPLGTLVILGAAIFFMERSFRAEKAKDARNLEQIKAEIDKLKQEQNKDS